MCVCILELANWHANCTFSAPHYAAIYGLSGSTMFFHVLIDHMIFGRH